MKTIAICISFIILFLSSIANSQFKDEVSPVDKLHPYTIDKNKGDLILAVAEDLNLGKFVRFNKQNEQRLFRLLVFNFKEDLNLAVEINKNGENKFIVKVSSYKLEDDRKIHHKKTSTFVNMGAILKIEKMIKNKAFNQLSQMNLEDRYTQVNGLAEFKIFSLEYYVGLDYKKIDLAKIKGHRSFNTSKKYKKSAVEFSLLLDSIIALTKN